MFFFEPKLYPALPALASSIATELAIGGAGELAIGAEELAIGVSVAIGVVGAIGAGELAIEVSGAIGVSGAIEAGELAIEVSGAVAAASGLWFRIFVHIFLQMCICSSFVFSWF